MQSNNDHALIQFPIDQPRQYDILYLIAAQPSDDLRLQTLTRKPRPFSAPHHLPYASIHGLSIPSSRSLTRIRLPRAPSISQPALQYPIIPLITA